MARITVEDCLGKIKNRFELVLLACKRVKQLTKEAASPLVPVDGDKMTVVALREIAQDLVTKESMEKAAHAEESSIAPIIEEPISEEIIAETQSVEVEENAELIAGLTELVLEEHGDDNDSGDEAKE